MHQLNSIYNSPFTDKHSHPIHTCLSVIASNEFWLNPWHRVLTTTDYHGLAIPGVCSFCWNLTNLFWVSHFVEFVLGRCSDFNIAIAYSNSKFCGAWTPSFCEFTCNSSKTSTPLFVYYIKLPLLRHDQHRQQCSQEQPLNMCFRSFAKIVDRELKFWYFNNDLRVLNDLRG